MKIARGTVTHWRGNPLETREAAEECLEAIEEMLGETGEVVEVIATIPLPTAGGETEA